MNSGRDQSDFNYAILDDEEPLSIPESTFTPPIVFSDAYSPNAPFVAGLDWLSPQSRVFSTSSANIFANSEEDWMNNFISEFWAESDESMKYNQTHNIARKIEDGEIQ